MPRACAPRSHSSIVQLFTFPPGIKKPHRVGRATLVRTCLTTNRGVYICGKVCSRADRPSVSVRFRGEIAMPRGATVGRGVRLPPGGALTCGDALGGVGVFSSPRHCSMHDHALWIPRYACRHHSMLVPGSIVLGCGTVRLRPLPLRWLHHRHITVVLPSVSVPPLL